MVIADLVRHLETVHQGDEVSTSQDKITGVLVVLIVLISMNLSRYNGVMESLEAVCHLQAALQYGPSVAANAVSAQTQPLH